MEGKNESKSASECGEHHLLHSPNHQHSFQNDYARAEEVQPKCAIAVPLQECHQKAKPHEDHDSHLHRFKP